MNYYEDDNYGGSSISHGRNRGYYDLTQHKTSLFGHSWNDRISSLQLTNLTICVLHWDIHWLGRYLDVPRVCPRLPGRSSKLPHQLGVLAATLWLERPSLLCRRLVTNATG